MDFSFFQTDNSSGYKTRENWFHQNHPEKHREIIEYSKNLGYQDISFKEKIVFYFLGLKERPKCKTCGEDIKFRNRLDKPYGEFCSLKCINENKDEMNSRIKKTMKSKYGVDYYPEHVDFIKKQKKTKLERYGDDKYTNIEKQKNTKLERYGDKNYNNFLKYKNTCLNRYGTENYSTSNSFKNKIIENFKGIYPDVDFIDIGKNMVTIMCKDCNNSFEINKQLLYERYKRNYTICTNCNPVGQSFISGYEQEISSFLNTMNIEHKKSIRNVIKGELDIFIENKNIAIEVNGVYWHNELFLPTDYHLRKTLDCQSNGIDLIHVFEDEWIYKKDIVKSIIKNRLNLIDNVIYARKCNIKEINQSICKEFLEQNHIQGNVNSKVRIGLYYGKELVSVMTFSKGRVIMGGKKDEWELTRFANVINTNVVGGSSKLFKYFLEKYKPEKIVSYSDIRLFNGGMYEKLGFTKVSQSKPNYWYVINNLRYHRFNFRKSVLIKEGFDKSKTEQEIMFERGVYRIYDCGNIRWEFKNSIY
jgi:hypothetical protein